MVTAFVFGSLVVALVGVLIGGLILLASDAKDWPVDENDKGDAVE